ncbi:MAG: PspC family transcriptional regulator [Bacteroidetes bacterium]|nr:PspC family transcriptional regulator [Bacteroidota bacterium]
MKRRVIETWTYIIEQRFYGVCSYLGEKLRISDSRIRLYFIYTSFLTFGSPVLFYLIVAFWMEMRGHTRQRRSVWDL